jgi:hypothetical protein
MHTKIRANAPVVVIDPEVIAKALVPAGEVPEPFHMLLAKDALRALTHRVGKLVEKPRVISKYSQANPHHTYKSIFMEINNE